MNYKNYSKRIFLGLGSNKGDSLNLIKSAIVELKKILREISYSSIYITSPMYNLNQPPFLNAVVTGFTNLPALDLLAETSKIENRLGRNRIREVYKGQRSMDLDILLYGVEIIQSETLKIPHPGIKERKFVLIPLLELEPELKDPELGAFYSESLKLLETQGVYYHNLESFYPFYAREGNKLHG